MISPFREVNFVLNSSSYQSCRPCVFTAVLPDRHSVPIWAIFMQKNRNLFSYLLFKMTINQEKQCCKDDEDAPSADFSPRRCVVVVWKDSCLTKFCPTSRHRNAVTLLQIHVYYKSGAQTHRYVPSWYVFVDSVRKCRMLSCTFGHSNAAGERETSRMTCK